MNTNIKNNNTNAIHIDYTFYCPFYKQNEIITGRNFPENSEYLKSIVIWKSDFEDFKNLGYSLHNLFCDGHFSLIRYKNFILVVGESHLINFLYE